MYTCVEKLKKNFILVLKTHLFGVFTLWLKSSEVLSTTNLYFYVR